MKQVILSAILGAVSLASNIPKFAEYLSAKNGNEFADDFVRSNVDSNKQPVIGILTQTLEGFMHNNTRFDGYNSYIMATFVNFLESAGARIIPLINGEPEDVTLSKLSKINGVLFPGGDGDYMEYGRFIFNKAKEINDNGTYFPIWGTCMGYENFAMYASTEGQSVVEKYVMYTTALPLTFVKDPRDTQMYSWLQDEAFLFEDHNLTWNGHNWGVNPAKFDTDPGLKEMFEVTAVSYMPAPDSRPFVASVESHKYPFFGTQFHPEQSVLFYGHNNADHSWLSIRLNRHFADYFVYLARHNTNQWGDFETVQQEIVENAPAIVTKEGTWYVYK